MRIKIKYNILLISLILIQSAVCCSDDYIPAQIEEEVDVRIVGCLNSDDHSTDDTLLAEGSDLGLFINEISRLEDNRLYTIRKVLENSKYSAVSNRIVGSPISLSKEKLYRVFGYSPYVSNYNSRKGIIQYEHNTDVLWTETYYPSCSSTNIVNEMPLIFNHLTSQVIFEIEDNRDNYSKERYPINNLSMKINGFPKYLYLDVYSGILIPGEVDSSVIIDEIGKPFCIAPTYHSEFSELNIIVSIENAEQSISAPQLFAKLISYKFLPNHSYTLKILLNTYSINYSATINKWEYRAADDLTILDNRNIL